MEWMARGGHGVQAWAWPSLRCLSPHRSPRAGPGQADGLGGSPCVSAQAAPPLVTWVTLPLPLCSDCRGLLCSRAVLSPELDSGGAPVEKQHRPGAGHAEVEAP